MSATGYRHSLPSGRYTAVLLACVLAGCGGSTAPVFDAAPAVASTAPAVPDAEVPAMTPMFHMAPVALVEPSDTDTDGDGISAFATPDKRVVPSEFSGMATSGLTPEKLLARRMAGKGSVQALTATAPPVITVYTPAQIRAAYSLPELPTASVLKTASGAAAMGAGQTIYIVDAYDHPTAFKDLTAFSSKFGLPTCQLVPVSATTKLPVVPASATAGCTLSVVYSASTSPAMTAKVPAYNAGWASESALDVQWAHATAPLARIVLIEAPDPGTNSLLNAIALANSMGPGIVSMSFGAPEGPWTAGADAVFQGKGMTYVASTGDAGAQMNWPAASARVLAVGGTTLTYTGAGTRSEVAWSLTGGGVSAYTPRPVYQNSLKLPGQGQPVPSTPKMRAVADVAFNADPRTGQYVAITPLNGQATNWYSYGGTSIAAPQWAGVIAVANATRALSNKAPLDSVHAALYTKIATVPGLYAGAFEDISAGADGTCITCAAGVGYDTLTGLGAPKVSSMLNALISY